MNDQRISITIAVTEEGFYSNAQLNAENFVCTTVQPTLDLSLASVAPYIRKYAATAATLIAHRQDERSLRESMLDQPNGPAINGSCAHATESQVWIIGKGWIDRSSVACEACGDEGYIVTSFSDEGDPENGPCLVPTDFSYCTCAVGVQLEQKDELDHEHYRAHFGIAEEETVYAPAELAECQECLDSGFLPDPEGVMGPAHDRWSFCSCPRGSAASDAFYREKEEAWELRSESRNR